MADKYIKLNQNGYLEEVVATSISTGVDSAGKIIALDAQGKIDSSLLPTGVGEEVKVLPTYEALAAGDFVNVFSDAGTIKVRKADASSIGKGADGFVLQSYGASVDANVYLAGFNNALSGLTGGSVYFLSDVTPGAISLTPPTTAGHVVQRIGKAVSATEMAVEIDVPVIKG
jgi:hypothetical protein